MSIQSLQGTLDLMMLSTLATMGLQYAYGVTGRLQMASDDALNLNHGTIYRPLFRIEQRGWLRGVWGKAGNSLCGGDQR
jgi:PadR family transcriptional regulator, regulatory protein PadR